MVDYLVEKEIELQLFNKGVEVMDEDICVDIDFKENEKDPYGKCFLHIDKKQFIFGTPVISSRMHFKNSTVNQEIEVIVQNAVNGIKAIFKNEANKRALYFKKISDAVGSLDSQ